MDAAWLLDGAPIDDLGRKWFVASGTNWPAVPTRRSSTLEIPSRNGMLSKRLGWGAGQVRLVFHVGAPQDENRSALVRRLAYANRVGLRVRDAKGVFSDRHVEVVSVEISEPTILPDPDWSTFEVTFITQPFWAGALATTTALALTNQTIILREWEGANAPIEDAILRVRGPITNMLFTGADGTTIRADVTVAADSYLFIDPATVTAWRGSEGAWGGGGTPVAVDYGTSGPLRLAPDANGNYALTVSGATGMTQDTTLTVRGRKWWL